MTKPNVAVVIGRKNHQRMMSQRAWQNLEEFANIIHHDKIEPATKSDLLQILGEVDAVICSWGVAKFDDEVLANAPRLKMFAHMGGSVKRFISRGFWEKKIRVTSAGIVLGEDVAMTTLGLMIVAMKRIFPLSKCVREGGWRDSPAWPSREIRNKTIGIIGAGNIGRKVIKLLKPFPVNILVY
ncbi:MAG: hypothetical protein KAR20_20120, partial [Candidatus Heimdallarchaeota archaeon]|nr:hypothetical protein [Candidatus Heimdallarchaeota archaeon]